MQPSEYQVRRTRAVKIASDYGEYDGSHHKMWVIDQMLRALFTEQEYAAWRETQPDWDEGTPP